MNKLLELALQVIETLNSVLETNESALQEELLEFLVDKVDVIIDGELPTLPDMIAMAVERDITVNLEVLRDRLSSGILNAVPTAKEIMGCLARCDLFASKKNLAELRNLFIGGAHLLGEGEFYAVRVKLSEDDPLKWVDLETKPDSRDMETKDREVVHPAWAMYLTIRNRKGEVITESERRELFGLMDSDLTLRRVRSIEKRYGFYKGN